MNEYNYNAEHELSKFLEEDPAQPPFCPDPAQSYFYAAPAQGQLYGYPESTSAQKKNPVISILLCGILVVGIAILTLQIWGLPGNNGSQALQNQPGYEQPFQNGQDTYGRDGDNDTYGNYGPDYNGDGGGAEQSGQFRADDGTIIQFRIKGGKVEYSTDGGNTWSETAPEGMPPLP